MKSSLKYPTTKGTAAFTLLEMMISIAILGLLTAMIGQALLTMSNAWQDTWQRVNNFGKARQLLGTLQQDIEAGVFRSDLACFPGSSVAFYTLRSDAALAITGGRQLSLVQYAINTSDPQSSLQRGQMGVTWSSAMSFGNTTNFGSNAPAQQDTTPGVVGFEVVFVQADGTYSQTYSSSTNPTRAIDVVLAVVDDQTMTKLYVANETAPLRNALVSAINSPGSIRSDWENYLHSGINWKAYPKNLATGLEIYESYVALPISH